MILWTTASRRTILRYLEHFRAIMTHSDPVLLFRAEERIATRCGVSGKRRDDGTEQKNRAFGGAYRLVGVVATLARCDGIARRVAPIRASRPAPSEWFIISRRRSKCAPNRLTAASKIFSSTIEYIACYAFAV